MILSLFIRCYRTRVWELPDNTVGIESLAGYSYYVTIIKLKNEMLLEQRSKQEKLFKNYLSEISSAYQEMADFRHDYRNLLLTLKLKIEVTGDKELKVSFRKARELVKILKKWSYQKVVKQGGSLV